MEPILEEVFCVGWDQVTASGVTQHNDCCENASNISVGSERFLEQLKICGRCEDKLREWEYEASEMIDDDIVGEGEKSSSSVMKNLQTDERLNSYELQTLF